MRARINFECLRCTRTLEKEFDIYEESQFQILRMKDIFSGNKLSITCFECGEVYEAYVVEDEGSLEVHVPSIGRQDCHVTHISPEFISGFSYELSRASSAYRNLVISIDDILCLMQDLRPDASRAREALSRMLFVQIVASMETYFSDTLIHEIDLNHDAIRKLLDQDKILSQEKVSLSSVFSDYDLVRKRVLNYLSSVLYHNIPKVESLFKIVFGFDFPFSDEAQKGRLNSATADRHHCVHRNGKKKNGEPLQFSDERLHSTIRDIVNLATNIENRLVTMRSDREKNRDAIGCFGDIPF